MDEDLECNLKPCPIDCVMSDWSAWDTTNNGGSQLTRTREIYTEMEHDGEECGDTLETKNFEDDCVPYNDAGDWSMCTKTCGTGYMYRNLIHHHCSETAAVKMMFKFRQGVHCNLRSCPTKEEALTPHMDVDVQDITHPPSSLPSVAEDAMLDEEVGVWTAVSNEERLQFGLPVGHWQMLRSQL
jgi:hypothetical protein